MQYIKRELEKTLIKYLNIFPAVAIMGPRQSGKSTFLLHLLKDDYKYVTFDDYRMLNLFYDDPEKFMQIYSNKVIFDEVQKVPELFNYLKIAIDNDRNNYGKFILSGSSQFIFLDKIKESLAGRIGLLSLLPFQYREIPSKLRSESVYKGSYPELINQKFLYNEDWYASYIETYLNKDLKSISNIGDIRDFRRFIRLLAANTSQIFTMSIFSRELGVSVSTIKRWVAILEASYIIFLLPPYYKNFGKRIIKSPKLYFYDTGLVSFLTGIKTEELYDNGPMAGAIFENYIVSEIKKKILHDNKKTELFYFRTSNGVEIDLIIDCDENKEFIEIKKTSSFNPRMVKNIENFLSKQDKGFLLYQGIKMPYLPNIEIIPYNDYLN
ncbi:MAG: ATP-binding protein [bacterium]|nr:ATP-binding protein [bacterium]